ncbi:MAG: patatin-like phospholipase family protein [Clostridiales bacterium]|jgi:NTE family protein|nr:patatin-like phospholipase family protein [Clostridiales bacterium]
MYKLCDGVFEGGGVKGIGLVGAVHEIEMAGYRFVNVVGTSAGAIVASLLGVGFTSGEIKDEMMKLDFRKFQKNDTLTGMGLVGKAVKFVWKNGVYSADYLEAWLEELFQRKGKTCFGDIRIENAEHERYRYKFQAIASDLSDSRMLVLPRDLQNFGLNPDRFSIAKAVRMSMSIPVFYEPVILTDADGRDHMIVDGGLLSNYPVWLLDDNAPDPLYPTFGFRFCSFGVDEYGPQDYQAIGTPVSFVKALVRTTLDAHDKHFISGASGDLERTIPISADIIINSKKCAVSAVHFGIKPQERDSLYQNGASAAKNFLRTWDFEEWKRKYRKKTRLMRKARIA